MRRHLPGLLVLGLCSACEPEPVAKDDTGPGQDDTGGDLSCEASSILSVRPDGSLAYVSLGVQVVVETDGGVLAAESAIVVTDGDGANVPFSGVAEGQRLVFTPDASLEPYTSYTFDAEVCGLSTSGAFTTGGYGEAPPLEALSGSTWALDLQHANWVEPEGGGSMLRQYFSGIILLGVQSVTTAEIDLLLGAGEDTKIGVLQDPCFETVDFEPVSFEDSPYVAMGPADLPVSVEGQLIVLHHTYLFAGFSADGSMLGDGILSAQADVRDVAGSTGYDPDDLCAMIEMFGFGCSECLADGEIYCLDLRVEEIEGERADGLTLVPVTETSGECD
jgi:hypothetical protein